MYAGRAGVDRAGTVEPVDASEDEAVGVGAPFAWLLPSLLLLAVVVVQSCRVVPKDERIVVFTFGRRGRVRGPGLVVVIPGIHRGVRVPADETWFDILHLDAVTSDAVAITVNGAALGRLVEPVRYALSRPSPTTVAIRIIEAEIGRYVADHTLAELAAHPPGQWPELVERVSTASAAWGGTVRSVELDRMEVAADRRLLRWARGAADDQSRRGDGRQ